MASRATPASTLRKATISDVADHAGVSIKTVSRVLNREPKVRESTKLRVEAAMKTLRYRPNSPGRMLASSRTYLIGLIYNDASSYINRVQSGVLQTCRDEHYDLLIHPCEFTDPALLDEIRDLVTAPRVDGLILVPPLSDMPDVKALVDELKVATVTLSSDSEAADADTVRTNDRESLHELVRYLTRLGHRRLAYVDGRPEHKAMAKRFLGFQDGLKDAGLELNPKWVVRGDNTFDSAIECGKQLLHGKDRPTAICCANDHMAAAIMKVAHESGLRVPADISITGFDDDPTASQVWPSLTTIRQPLTKMARHASKLLLDGLRGLEPETRNRVVDADIVIRDSTGPAPTRL
ncbi:MAG: LacI family DNA-binding transcriptional regulator [Pseudomonadota bacterium]